MVPTHPQYRSAHLENVTRALLFGSGIIVLFLVTFAAIQSMRGFINLAPHILLTAAVFDVIAALASFYSRIIRHRQTARRASTLVLAAVVLWFLLQYMVPKFQDLYYSTIDCWDRTGQLF